MILIIDVDKKRWKYEQLWAIYWVYFFVKKGGTKPETTKNYRLNGLTGWPKPCQEDSDGESIGRGVKFQRARCWEGSGRVLTTGKAKKDSWVVVSNIFYFQPYLGKWSNLTSIFQLGWNHHLEKIASRELTYPSQPALLSRWVYFLPRSFFFSFQE